MVRCGKFRALLKKNLILKYRSWGLTLSEFLVPFLALGLQYVFSQLYSNGAQFSLSIQQFVTVPLAMIFLCRFIVVQMTEERESGLSSQLLTFMNVNSFWYICSFLVVQ